MSLRWSLAWLIAALFVFNGAASLALIAVPAALAPHSESHHAVGTTSGQAMNPGRHQYNDGAVSAQNRAQSHEHVDSCLKCCQMCNVASMVPVVPTSKVPFFNASVLFPFGKDDLSDYFAALDPGIPKSVI